MNTICNLLVSFAKVLAAMSPWLVVGFLAAGVIAVWIPRAWVNRVMGGSSGFSGILRAVLVGVPLPICSCGVHSDCRLARSHGGSLGLRRIPRRDDGLQPNPARQDGARQAHRQAMLFFL